MLREEFKRKCKKHGIIPARSRGQNFLVNEEVYEKIVNAAKIEKDDYVLEVGPGLGFLTEKLASQAGKVVAVELDKKVYEVLERSLSGVKNLEIINEDVLDLLNLESGIWNLDKDKLKIPNSKFQIPNSNFKIVANLPYNITSIFLRKVYELENKPELMVLMLQKEVAERIAAGPGKMSKLAVMCQLYADPEILFDVPRQDFWPSPEVDSAVIRLTERKNPPFPRGVNSAAVGGLEKEFFRLLRIAFAQKRKMLKNNLANGYHISQEEAETWLADAGFKSNVRAQELGVKDWKLLSQKSNLKNQNYNSNINI